MGISNDTCTKCEAAKRHDVIISRSLFWRSIPQFTVEKVLPEFFFCKLTESVVQTHFLHVQQRRAGRSGSFSIFSCRCQAISCPDVDSWSESVRSSLILVDFEKERLVFGSTLFGSAVHESIVFEINSFFAGCQGSHWWRDSCGPSFCLQCWPTYLLLQQAVSFSCSFLPNQGSQAQIKIQEGPILSVKKKSHLIIKKKAMQVALSDCQIQLLFCFVTGRLDLCLFDLDLDLQVGPGQSECGLSEFLPNLIWKNSCRKFFLLFCGLNSLLDSTQFIRIPAELEGFFLFSNLFSLFETPW